MANEILEEFGIGLHDQGGLLLEYCVIGDVVMICDYNSCVTVEDWQSTSEADIELEAEIYIKAMT